MTTKPTPFVRSCLDNLCLEEGREAEEKGEGGEIESQ